MEPREEQTLDEHRRRHYRGSYSYEEALEIILLLNRIMERASVKRNGSDIIIEIPEGVRLCVRKRPAVLGAQAAWLNGESRASHGLVSRAL